MSLDNRRAAKELILTERYRSSISRACYAAYCAVTDALADQVDFTYGGNNPSHESFSNLIVNNLYGMSVNDKHRLRRAVERLRASRVEADYAPLAYIDRDIAVNSLRDATFVQELLGIRDEQE
jgi:uncharacterized protein (UPF0332 family)